MCIRNPQAPSLAISARTTHSSDGEAVKAPPHPRRPVRGLTPPLAMPYPASSSRTWSTKTVASPSTNDEPSPRDKTEPLSGNLS
jgi:hypothetical protein